MDVLESYDDADCAYTNHGKEAVLTESMCLAHIEERATEDS